MGNEYDRTYAKFAYMTLLGEIPPDERSETRATEDGSTIPVLETDRILSRIDRQLYAN